MSADTPVTDPRPGDRIRWTRIVDGVVGEVWAGTIHVTDDDGNVRVLNTAVESATVEVLERADDPGKDPLGTRREMPATDHSRSDSASIGPFAIKWDENDEKPWVWFRWDGPQLLTNDTVAGWSVESPVPGTPAAEAAGPRGIQFVGPVIAADLAKDVTAGAVDTGPAPGRPRPPYPYEIREWVDQGARVECFSGADSSYVVHEGRAIGWTPAPTVRVQKDDGQIISWVAGITRLAQSRLGSS